MAKAASYGDDLSFSNSFSLKELAYRKEMVRAELINKKVGIRYALKTSFIYLLLERIQA